MKLIHKVYDVVDSTQDISKKLSNEIKEDTFLLCTAEEQKNGRGTKSRLWLSPPKVNIYATYGFWLPLSRARLLPLIPQVAAYSVFSTLKSLQLDEVTIKWVNDVLLENKKVCGLLSEAFAQPSRQGFFVSVGVGLNVNMDKALCNSLDQPLTSLKASTGIEYDKEKVLSILTGYMMSNISLLTEQGFRDFYPKISQVLAFKKELIFFDTENPRCFPSAFYAKVIGINPSGALILEPELDSCSLANLRKVLNSTTSCENPRQLTVITGRILGSG